MSLLSRLILLALASISSASGASDDSLLPSQPALLAAALDSIVQGTPGVDETYFIGFAGDGEQYVFGREVRYARRALGQRLDLHQRAVELINSPDRGTQGPLATRQTLRVAIAGLADKMNLEEDVLILFLTSHGAKNSRLSVRQPGLTFRALTASELRSALDQAGVRWRIVIVSACFSGSFLDALKDPYTLIATAARADRTSFGCTDDRDLTYFGEALFKDALPRADSLREALWKARDIVAAREEAEGLIASEPQIYVGREMYTKLEEIPLR